MITNNQDQKIKMMPLQRCYVYQYRKRSLIKKTIIFTSRLSRISFHLGKTIGFFQGYILRFGSAFSVRSNCVIICNPFWFQLPQENMACKQVVYERSLVVRHRECSQIFYGTTHQFKYLIMVSIFTCIWIELHSVSYWIGCYPHFTILLCLNCLLLCHL